jgi:hypothetical protein
MDYTEKKSADVEDTLRLIRRTVPETLWHTEKIARVLKGRTLEETCENIWNFVYNHIQYKKDEKGYEQVRSPRRAWSDRKSGVDCDCYTEFISSILSNLKIRHKLRIAAYDPALGWQHIYPVIPRDGRLDYELTNSRDYIVIDCVKDRYDDEQPYLTTKDYPMQLQFLDGIPPAKPYRSIDAQDLYGNDLGNIFDTIGDAVKTTVQNVSNAVSTTVTKVADAAAPVIRTIETYSPLTVLLRNGFLECMKLNMFGVAEKLRYGYLTEAQARAMNMNMDSYNKIKSILSKAEDTYYNAGGEKVNLKNAILNGKGNDDKKVPLSGFSGFSGVSAGLGDPATATAIATATAAVTALAELLKQIKSLFNPGTPEAAAEAAANAGTTVMTAVPSGIGPVTAAPVSTGSNSSGSFSYVKPPELTDNSNSSGIVLYPGDTGSSIQPGNTSPAPNVTSPPTQQTQPPAPVNEIPQTVDTVPNPYAPQGFLSKAGDWIKANPVPSVLIGAAVAGGGYMLYKSRHKKVKSLSGLPKSRKRKKKRKTTSKASRAKSRSKNIYAVNIR